MTNNMFSTLLAAAVKVETPVDGSTGVWLKSGATVISSGMKMVGAVVSSGQSQYVYSRGVARTTLILAGGLQRVNISGSALGVVVSNAPTSDTLIASDGYVSGLELFNASAFCDGSAGVLSGAMLRASGTGYPTRLSCWHGSATDVTVSGGAVFNVSAGAHIGSVAVYSGGYMPVYGGCAVEQCTCNAACIISAYGGTFDNVVMNDRGTFTADGCSINSVTVGTGRGVITVAGGEFSNKSIHTLTVIYYNSRASGSNMTIGNSAIAQIRATVSSFTVTSGGSAVLFTGGILHGATVESGGTLTVSSGGTALAVTSNAGATVTGAGYIEYA